MKIAYSVNGEGFGHASRMVSLVPGLSHRHELSLFGAESVSGWISERLPGRTVAPIPAFHFAKRRDRILYARTGFMNIPVVFSAVGAVFQLARQLRTQGFEAVISDFEPILAWAGRLAGLPVLQFNHPGIILKHFSFKPARLAAAFVAWLMEGPWTARLHCSFFGGDIGPILRPELKRRSTCRGNYLVVHLKTGYREQVLQELEKLALQMPGLKWQAFPNPHGNFEEALAGCRAVVTAGGHQMISEALSLGKPVLALPQQGQDEQFLNARMLEKSQRGMSGKLENLATLIPDFLARLHDFESAFNKPSPKGFQLQDCLEAAVNRITDLLRPAGTIHAVLTTGANQLPAIRHNLDSAAHRQSSVI